MTTTLVVVMTKSIASYLIIAACIISTGFAAYSTYFNASEETSTPATSLVTPSNTEAAASRSQNYSAVQYSVGDNATTVFAREYGELDGSGSVVLYLHGVAGRETQKVEDASTVAPVLSPTYPTGSLSVLGPDDSLIYETVDASIAYLRESGYDDSDIHVFGFSLGSSPAIYAAVNYPEVARVYVVGGFSSFNDTCQILAPQFCTLAPASFLNTASFAADTVAPIDQYHATDDLVVDISLGKKLHAAIGGPKSFTELSGGHAEFDIIDILSL